MNVCVDTEMAFGADIINNIPECYMISVGYKVNQVSINVKVPPYRWPVDWEPQYYKVRVDAEGSTQERENAVRSIMGWDDEAILPDHYPNGSFDIVAPYPIDTHREFLTNVGFVGQHAVEGATFVSGNAWFLHTGKNVKVEVHENLEMNVTMTRKGYERHVVNLLQRKKKGNK
ncbi:hypothetical protein RHMOL_Rhmol10G0130100 [Rhododendron molle]|uniref:Uncharacterized protein n=1 Tax=Rhododendron molle TaxID=49168 RepID=A0ACC0M1K0_RHOML|nr:hypothetical protein RHMOL_Rhmol10G0130100 [Rhododendron molle]